MVHKRKSFMQERISKGDIFVRDPKTGGLMRIGAKLKKDPYVKRLTRFEKATQKTGGTYPSHYYTTVKKMLKKAGVNPHVHTKIQLKKMTKTGLIRLVIKLEKFIVSHAYEMYKAKLPRLRTTRPQLSLSDKQSLKRIKDWDKPFRKTKRKKLTGAAKAKFLARMNKGRRRKGLKPIRSKKR